MKVEEIRNQLKSWSQEDIVKLYTKTYRRLPKAVKEEIDEIILTGLRAEKKPVKKVPSKPDLSALEAEINIFIENALNGNYYYSNRTISKKERSNWRFTVKRFIKELEVFNPEDEGFDKSNILLCRIYDILGHATSFYTFASQEPYHTLGYKSQSGFFSQICKRVRDSTTDSLEPMKELIRCGCNGNNDFENVDRYIHYAILDTFQEPEEVQDLQNLAQELFVPVRNRYESMYKGKYSSLITEDEIITRGKYESLTWFIAAVMIRQDDLHRAYDFIKDVAPNASREIDLYCILSYYADTSDNWKELYNMGIQEGIEPREGLKNKYKKLKNALV